MNALDFLKDAIAAAAPALSNDDVLAWSAALRPALDKADVNTPRRITVFLGQVSKETGGFRMLSEDLNYSAARLCAVWPRHFPSLAVATPYAHQPEKLANFVYAERLGNGPEASGDGWRFRGRGLIQLTGRALYADFGATCGRSPEDAAAYLETKEGAAASAAYFWSRADLNPLADAWAIDAVTQKVNGGATDLSTRISLSTAALAALDADESAPISAVA